MKSFSHTIILVLRLGCNLNLGAKERNVFHLSLLVYLSGGCAAPFNSCTKSRPSVWLDKMFLYHSKKQILLTEIIFVVAAMCHFGCCGRWLSSSCQLLVFFHQPHFQNNESWRLVLACSGLLVRIGCGWNLLPELEAVTGWIWASESLLWKGKWTISRLNSLLKWHAFFSAAILLVGTLNSCIRSMGMIINAELRIQILPFLLHLSILSFEENTGYFM